MLIERNGALFSISIRSSTVLFVTRLSDCPRTLIVAMTVPMDPGSRARGIGLTPRPRRADWICDGVPDAVKLVASFAKVASSSLDNVAVSMSNSL